MGVTCVYEVTALGSTPLQEKFDELIHRISKKLECQQKKSNEFKIISETYVSNQNDSVNGWVNSNGQILNNQQQVFLRKFHIMNLSNHPLSTFIVQEPTPKTSPNNEIVTAALNTEHLEDLEKKIMWDYILLADAF